MLYISVELLGSLIVSTIVSSQTYKHSASHGIASHVEGPEHYWLGELHLFPVNHF